VTCACDVVLEESQFYPAPFSIFREHEVVVGRVRSDAQPVESLRAATNCKRGSIALDDSREFCFLRWGRCEDAGLRGW